MNLHYFYTLGIVSILTACGHHSTPERERLDLSGQWQSSLGPISLPGTTDEARLGNRNTDTTNSQRLTRLYPYSGKVYYEKDIDIPESFKNKHISLFMERTKPSTLWIDGDSIATFRHLYAPHIYDISRITPGKHRLKIRIDNGENSVPKGVQGSHAWTDATQTNWNGILGDFYIEAANKSYIKDIQVFPQTDEQKAIVKLTIHADKPQNGTFSLKAHAWNCEDSQNIDIQTMEWSISHAGDTLIDIAYPMGDSPLLWSEFSPTLYRLNVTCQTDGGDDSQSVDFGMRNFKTKGTQFTINGLTTFLRGTHDGCVFPLTGYAPMDKDSWAHVFETAKSYGINHFRFHSWTPPRAAFEAADEAGIYLQPEIPYWGEMKEGNDTLNQFLYAEGKDIIKTFGNHPSFTMMALGNELYGSYKLMRQFIDAYKEMDDRHLYAFGSNNNLGTAGQQDGEDFFVTCRVGSDKDSTYATHVRTSFSFADAYKGGLLNGRYPSTMPTYSGAIAPCSVPVISHESGQFQVYPDYNEISKYTGVLYPYNFEIFRRRLHENNMDNQAADFHRATGQFVAICYKADIETCLRTPGFGGFQLLDLKDYPGQGTALVGILDAFMDSKEILTPEQFREFCGPIVPMAQFPRYCWNNADTFKATLIASNYSESAMTENFTWSILDAQNHILTQNSRLFTAGQGAVSTLDSITFRLDSIKDAQKLSLQLKYGSHQNRYDFWVYPQTPEIDADSILTTRQLTPEILKNLEEGADILYIPNHDAITKQSVGGTFTPDYWNYSMFKSISEWLKREVSPGTLSILTEPNHPLFKNFPTESHSNWQWFSICQNARPLIIDGTPKEYIPLVQVVDNIERSHKLGLILEFAVGKGRILVSMCNLDAVQNTPEGRQFRKAIYDYMQSKEFKPTFCLDSESLSSLFTRSVNNRQIIGVKNITSYE